MLSCQKIFLFIAIGFACRLQAQNAGSISGRLQDSATKQNLTFGTITVYKAKDTSIISYRLSNLEGNFKITDLPLGIPYRILISYSGYEVLRFEKELTIEKPEIDLGTLFMVPTVLALDEVLVVAERPPVIVRNDTIEFNASSFRTLPNALVEDLLK